MCSFWFDCITRFKNTLHIYTSASAALRTYYAIENEISFKLHCLLFCRFLDLQWVKHLYTLHWEWVCYLFAYTGAAQRFWEKNPFWLSKAKRHPTNVKRSVKSGSGNSNISNKSSKSTRKCQIDIHLIKRFLQSKLLQTVQSLIFYHLHMNLL